jgi:phosphate transport system substrate-binding protein
VGSGAGIQQFTAKTVDFGATDAPMKPDELAAAQKAGGAVLHIPMVLGAVAVTYNVPGVSHLRLDGTTLADIYLGKITSWNDRAIAALNPQAKLPKLPIAVVHRGDASGTSFVFTSYLTAVSTAWSGGPGADKAPKWPVGTGGQGNDGVAAAVTQQTGAIGYVEIAYALQNHLPTATLQNSSGAWINPSLASTAAAGTGVQFPADLRFSLVNSAAPDAYPIVSCTWQLVWQHPAKAGQSAATAKSLVTWLTWELTTGQHEAPTLGYAPLPAALATKARAAVASIQT